MIEVEELPPEQRIALAYTPTKFREKLAVIFALDQRLSRIVAQATEPMLAQLRLAWWRDELGKPVSERPSGDAVLDAIGKHWAGQEGALTPLVDAWELLLVEPPLPQHVALEFVSNRSKPFAGLAKLVGGDASDEAARASSIWAAMDASLHASERDERAAFNEIALSAEVPPLPRSLRGLTVLAGLSRRAALRDEPILMAGRRGALSALRLGIFGR